MNNTFDKKSHDAKRNAERRAKEIKELQEGIFYREFCIKENEATGYTESNWSHKKEIREMQSRIDLISTSKEVEQATEETSILPVSKEEQSLEVSKLYKQKEKIERYMLSGGTTDYSELLKSTKERIRRLRIELGLEEDGSKSNIQIVTGETINAKLREESGEINLTDPFAVLFYDILRDGHIPLSEFESLVRDLEVSAAKGNSKYLMSNGWIAKYAENLSNRVFSCGKRNPDLPFSSEGK